MTKAKVNASPTVDKTRFDSGAARDRPTSDIVDEFPLARSTWNSTPASALGEHADRGDRMRRHRRIVSLPGRQATAC
jgi:hypothetical protein